MSEISTADALDIFQLPWDFTLDELKVAYRRVSLAVHPDRGGTTEMFNTVNQCYQHLVHEHGFRIGSASHFDMKRDHESHIEHIADPSMYAEPGNQFNLTQFNQVFDKHRYQDDFSRGGYDNFFKETPINAAPESLSENQSFNSAFMSRVRPREQNAIIVKPAPLLDKGSLPFTEIGIDQVDDYGSQVGDIHAFDCKQAYSEESMAADFDAFREVPLKKYDVNHISAQRSQYLDSVWDTDAQKAFDLQKQEQEREMSRRRRDIMLRADREAYKSHAECNRQMLGYR